MYTYTIYTYTYVNICTTVIRFENNPQYINSNCVMSKILQ